MLFFILLACKPPPPAPEGLDAVTTYMFREFYSEDETFQAGIQGFMNWYNDEGYELIGERSTVETTETFSLGDLTSADLSQIVTDDSNNQDTDEDGTPDPRDLSRAKGVISLAEMQCNWKVAEEYLLRKDQDAVFAGDWNDYEREFLGDRNVYRQATIDEDFPNVREQITQENVDLFPKNFLFTLNQVTPTEILFTQLDSYELNFDLRHGFYEVDGEDLGLFAILTYQKAAVFDSDRKNGLAQSYSIELNISRSEDTTLRVLAVWAEPVSNIIEPDDPIVLKTAVDKSLDSSERISAICAGEEEIPPEN
jgi:hypothetical protein